MISEQDILESIESPAEKAKPEVPGGALWTHWHQSIQSNFEQADIANDERSLLEQAMRG